MAETVKKGRPKKATTETTAKVENTVEINNNDQSEIIKQLMEQIQKQLFNNYILISFHH